MVKKEKVKRIGVLTGGGDCPGINAVLRAVVKTAVNDYNMEVVGFEDGFDGLVRDKARELLLKDASGILTEGGTILGTSNVANPFRWPQPKGDGVEWVDLSGQVAENYKRHGLDALICIGGDGTMHISLGLTKKGLKIVGVPKTIDNDLMGTDYTFGFQTAASTAAEAIDKIHSTAESHHRVMIVELMGRYVGWLTLYAGMASGADLILIPELPYSLKEVIERVQDRSRRGKRFSIIAIAEGAKEKGSDLTVNRKVEKSPDPIRLGGVGNKLARQIEDASGLEARVTVLGHLQRGGSPVPFDRLLATQFGCTAVHLAAQGKSGRMAASVNGALTHIPIAQAVKDLKKVPRNHILIQNALSLGIAFGIPDV